MLGCFRNVMGINGVFCFKEYSRWNLVSPFTSSCTFFFFNLYLPFSMCFIDLVKNNILNAEVKSKTPKLCKVLGNRDNKVQNKNPLVTRVTIKRCKVKGRDRAK